MARPELLERYRALPLPTTTDESWRFTDLKGFDPDVVLRERRGGVATAPGLLELEAAGIVRVSEGGLEIERAPDGIRFEPLADHPRLDELVGSDEKFAAHNAADLAARPARPGAEGRRARAAALRPDRRTSLEGGSLFWRLLVVAEPESRFTVIEEYTSTSPELAGYVNAAVEIFVEQGAKVEYVSVQNVSRETWHFGSHHARVERDAELDWVAGGFGSKKGKIRIQNDLAGPGATSRVTGAYFADGVQHLDYDTFQEHIAPNTTSDFAFKGALRDKSTAVWRGMIRVEHDAQKTNAYQENRNLLLSKHAHADSIPGLEILANDVRCTHGATLGQVDREQLFYLMARGLSRARGGAPDRARLLPGRARPDRARAGARGPRRRARGPHPERLTLPLPSERREDGAVRTRSSCCSSRRPCSCPAAGTMSRAQVPTVTIAAPPASGCTPATTDLMTPLANKLRIENARLINGQIVKSADHDDVYFVSAELDSPAARSVGRRGDVGDDEPRRGRGHLQRERPRARRLELARRRRPSTSSRPTRAPRSPAPASSAKRLDVKFRRAGGRPRHGAGNRPRP